MIDEKAGFHLFTGNSFLFSKGKHKLSPVSVLCPA